MCAQTRNTYRFYNTLSTTEPDCSEDLIPTKESNIMCDPSTAPTPGSFIPDALNASNINRTVYHNNLNWGLKYLNTTGVISRTYTVQMYIKVTNFNQVYTRIIDFSNGVEDNGIYFTNNGVFPATNDRCLNFYPSGNFGICPFFNDTTYYLLTFTRNDLTKQIDIYVNDQLFTSYNDAADFYVSTAGRPVHIFRDDPVGFACEDGEANFAYLSFADIFSSQADVALIYQNINTIASTAGFSFSASPSCVGKDITVNYTGNIPASATQYNFNWTWDGGDVISGNGRGPYLVEWLTTGTKNITLTITGGGCGAAITNEQVISILPATLFVSNVSICSGNSYQGHTTPGTYSTIFSVPGDCDSISKVNLTVTPALSSSIDTTICPGDSYEGYTATGNYMQHYTTVDGCDSNRIINLTVASFIEPDLGNKNILCLGDSIVLSPGQYQTYLWQDGSVLSTYTVKRSGLYTVSVTDQCNTGTTRLQIKDSDCDIFFPTAFTPNKDEKNSIFKILTDATLHEYNMVIYNRYGEKVFETADPLNGWDGKLKNKDQPAAVYVWKCTYKKKNNYRQQFLQGSVILIR